MIRKFFKSAAAAAVIAAAFMTASCTKDNTPGSGSQNGDQQEEITAEVLGTYDFDGQEYKILTAAFEEDASYYSFIFSPIEAGKTISTYLYFSIRKYWGDGEIHNVGTIDQDHNDDYVIVYEDPVHLYSQFREPQEGTYKVIIPEDRSDVFHIMLDVKLADGTPLKIDYNGRLDSGSVNQ